MYPEDITSTNLDRFYATFGVSLAISVAVAYLCSDIFVEQFLGMLDQLAFVILKILILF